MSHVEESAEHAGGRTARADAATPADPRRWRALSVLALVQFIIFLDATIVNVALPSIQDDLGFSSAGLAWVVNGYLITAGGLLLLGGRIADMFGRRRMFCAGATLFAVASLTAGLAPNAPTLLAGRFAQGLAEALAAPAAMSMVALLFTSPAERAKAFGIWGGLAGLGSISGVVLSGVLTDLASWRWVFLINIPLALVPALVLPKLADESRADGRRRPDWIAAVLVTGGLIAVIDGVLAAARHAWGEPRVLVPLIGGLVALAVFVTVERRREEPLIPLRFFAHRVRLTGNVATVFIAGTSAAVFFLVVLYTQNVLGYTPLQSGLAWVPFCIAFMPGLFLSTKLITTLGPRGTLAIGLLISAIGVLLLARLPVGGSFVTDLLPATVVTALGFGMTNPAMQNTAVHDVSEADAGLGSGVTTTVLQMGGALGLTVFVTIALRHAQGEAAGGAEALAATTAGYRLTFLVAGIALVIGSVATFLLLRGVRPDAAETGPAAPEAAEASAVPGPSASAQPVDRKREAAGARR
jgi:EmrB/QacA subfamily drug resistance transporter